MTTNPRRSSLTRRSVAALALVVGLGSLGLGHAASSSTESKAPTSAQVAGGLVCWAEVNHQMVGGTERICGTPAQFAVTYARGIVR